MTTAAKKPRTQARTALPTDPTTAAAIVEWLQAAGVTTIEQARLLLTAASQELTVSELGHRCGIPLSTASRVVWQLTESGFLSLQPTPGDRRKKIVRAEFQHVAA